MLKFQNLIAFHVDTGQHDIRVCVCVNAVILYLSCVTTMQSA